MMQTKTEVREIEAFLYKEARYIDQNELSSWVELFTQDCHYWIPCNEADIDPETHVSIIYDDRARLEERVERLGTGLAYGQQPRSQTRHLITNVEIIEDTNDLMKVTSNFILVELRRGKQTHLVGRSEHRLVKDDEDWKIRLKKIELINNNEPLGNLSFIL